MRPSPTANQLRGRAIGATFFASFGTLWIVLALYVKQSLHAGAATWLAMILLVLLGTAAWLLRQSGRLPQVADDPARGRKFMWINALQWVAVSLVAVSFARLNLDCYVLCAITAIVGLHLFPLARLFRYPLHYGTGGVLVVWAALSACVLPAEQMQGTSAMGTGIILLFSAWLTLALAACQVRSATGNGRRPSAA